MSTGYKILIAVIVLLVLGALTYVAWRLLRGGNGSDPATDISPNDNPVVNPNNDNNNTPPPPVPPVTGDPNAPTPFTLFTVGDRVFAVQETCVYDASPASGGNLKKCYQPGAYVGTVQTKGSTAMTLRNYNDFGTQSLYLVKYDNKYRKG